MKDLRYADDRYKNDPVFYQLVKSLENAIETLNLSPSEVREAALYANLRVEMRRGPRPIALSPELKAYLQAEELKYRKRPLGYMGDVNGPGCDPDVP